MMNFILGIFGDANLTTMIVALVMGVFFLYMGIYGGQKSDFFDEKGIKADGIVFDMEDNSSGNYFFNSTDMDSNNRKLIIRFITREKEWITGEPSISATSYGIGGIKKGDNVKVLYNPDNPKEFAINNSGFKVFAPIATVIGLGALGYAIYSGYQYLTS